MLNPLGEILYATLLLNVYKDYVKIFFKLYYNFEKKE